MIWLMEVLKIKTEEQLLTKYYIIQHLILLKIRNMMDIIVDLFQWSINFLIKKYLVEPLRLQINLRLKVNNYTNQLLENLIKDKYTHLL